jgi:hypothetical protein
VRFRTVVIFLRVDQPLNPWRPGLFGKGAVFPDGTLVTWAIEGGVDGKPFHDTVCALSGRDDRMPVVLWIEPGGQVFTYPDPAVPVVPNFIELLQEHHADPSVVADEGFDFG